MIEKGESPFAAAERELFEETGIKIKRPLEYLWQFKEKGNIFYIYTYKADSLLTVSDDAKDRYEHTEWGYFRLEKNSLPQPISEEIKEAILKLET